MNDQRAFRWRGDFTTSAGTERSHKRRKLQEKKS